MTKTGCNSGGLIGPRGRAAGGAGEKAGDEGVSLITQSSQIAFVTGHRATLMATPGGQAGPM